MKAFSGLWFPAAVVSATVAGILGSAPGDMPLAHHSPMPVPDTVVYVPDAYKLGRTGDLGEFKIADSLLAGTDIAEEDLLDTLPTSPPGTQ